MEYTLTPKQSMVFETTANEILSGGAVSSGKTFVNKLLAISVCLDVPNVQVAILRNTSKNLKKNYLTGESSLQNLLYDYIKSKEVSINYSDMTVNFKNGACIHLMHADHVETCIENLTGIELQLVIADEGSLIEEEILKFAKTRLRIGSLKIENEFWKARLPRWQCSTNPGGISHRYLKERFIDPAPPMTEFQDDVGKTLIFIPAFFYDNPAINHAAYEKEIRSIGDPVKIAQLLDGNWDAGASTYFEYAFRRDRNIIPTCKVSESWPVSRAYDDGYSSPFAVLWIATITDDNEVTMQDGTKVLLPYGSKVVVDEWYGCKPNERAVGLQMDPKEIAKGILKREEEAGYGDRVQPGAADSSIYRTDRPVANDMLSMGVRFVPADKSKGSRVRGWRAVAEMLQNAHPSYIEKPALFFMAHCTHVISDVAAAPVSKKDPDDIDTNSLDHTLDTLRYEICNKGHNLGLIKVTGL